MVDEGGKSLAALGMTNGLKVSTSQKSQRYREEKKSRRAPFFFLYVARAFMLALGGRRGRYTIAGGLRSSKRAAGGSGASMGVRR